MKEFVKDFLWVFVVMDEKLAVFLPELAGGGAQRTMLKLVNGFARRGYSVDLVLAQAYGPFLAEVGEGVSVVDLSASRTLTSVPGLARYFREVKPNAVISALHHANIVAILARKLAGSNTKLIISERNTLSVEASNPMNFQTGQMPRLARLFYPKADWVVAVSEGVATDLIDLTGIDSAKVRVVYNPVVTPELMEKSQVECDHPWFAAGEVPVVLSVGRLADQKDFATLIRAFSLVRQEVDVRLLILGEGPNRKELEALIEELGLGDVVGLPGFVGNPYPYMRRAGVFTLSSRWEGLPGALIEAAYCGVPLVATDCPSGPKEILFNGRYGRLVPMGDIRAIAEAITDALVGKIAPPPATSWERFEIDAVMDQYLELMLS